MTRLVPVLALLAILGAPRPAGALESFDFEAPYLVHPDNEVWDFAIVRDGATYHAYYHTIPRDIEHPAAADTIWHAVSADLVRWTRVGPALAVGEEWYDAEAMWAPDVVFDPATGRWAMLYTGVTANMVQRACLAWSDDLATWTKSPANPVFEPDSTVYDWALTKAWSSFRDPFVYHDGAQWVMLSTAGIRNDPGPPARFGIVHKAVSPDLVAWSDAGPFYTHNGTGGSTRDLESVQYLVRGGWHHLFFVEQDLNIDDHPTSHLVASDPSGWRMNDRDVVDAGWAPEIDLFDADAPMAVFARLAKDKDPRDGKWIVTMRCDSVRFDDGGMTPVVVRTDPLARDWPVRSGAAAQPAFGENAELRGEDPLGVHGYGWFSTHENYGGPLSGVGAPAAAWGDSATGRIESRPFTITGGHLRLLMAGGYHAGTCYVALLDDATGDELARIHANGTNRLAERLWDLGPWWGRTVRLAVVDRETGPDGWIAVDGIEERWGGLSAVGDAPHAAAGLQAWPNPFNPRTTFRMTSPRAGVGRIAVFDVRGRRVWRSVGMAVDAGDELCLAWDGRDAAGRALPGGLYFARAVVGGQRVGTTRVVLLK